MSCSDTRCFTPKRPVILFEHVLEQFICLLFREEQNTGVVFPVVVGEWANEVPEEVRHRKLCYDQFVICTASFETRQLWARCGPRAEDRDEMVRFRF